MTCESESGVSRILLLAANPGETTRLSVAVEAREVEQALHRGRFHDRFELIHAPATRLQDIPSLLDRWQPRIVHFAGHGSESREELVFHDGQDRAIPARVDLIAQLLERSDGVVLNACYSARQAEAIAFLGPWAIGTPMMIEDREAKVLARCFYEKLANGCDVDEAFHGAAIQVGLEGRPRSEVLPQFFPGARSLSIASIYPLTNALVQLYARSRRERVAVRTFHRLLVVRDLAPDYFRTVFDVIKGGTSIRITQWLRQHAERHALAPTADISLPTLEDPILKKARELASKEQLTEVDIRCYLLTLLGEKDSRTIGEIRNQFDKATPDGFQRLVSTANSHRPEPYALRSSTIMPLDLGG